MINCRTSRRPPCRLDPARGSVASSCAHISFREIECSIYLKKNHNANSRVTRISVTSVEWPRRIIFCSFMFSSQFFLVFVKASGSCMNLTAYYLIVLRSILFPFTIWSLKTIQNFIIFSCILFKITFNRTVKKNQVAILPHSKIASHSRVRSANLWKLACCPTSFLPTYFFFVQTSLRLFAICRKKNMSRVAWPLKNGHEPPAQGEYRSRKRIGVLPISRCFSYSALSILWMCIMRINAVDCGMCFNVRRKARCKASVLGKLCNC